MCGMHADGNKATGFKSMVVAQFVTGVGLQKDDNAFVLYDDVSETYKTESEVTIFDKKPLHLNSNAIYKPDYENFHIKASNDAVIQTYLSLLLVMHNTLSATLVVTSL